MSVLRKHFDKVWSSELFPLSRVFPLGGRRVLRWVQVAEGSRWGFEFLGCFLIGMIMPMGFFFVFCGVFCLFRSYFFEDKNSYLLLFYSLPCVIHLATHWMYQLQIPESTQKCFQNLLRSFSLPVSSTVTCVPSCSSFPGRFLLLI